MTFRNKALLFFSFLLLAGCKGVKYYQSGTNPAGISVIIQSPTTYFTDTANEGNVKLYIINHNSKEVQLANWWQNIQLIGTSRFNNKELTTLIPTANQRLETITLVPNDTILVYSFPLSYILDNGVLWNYYNTTKTVPPPHKISKKKFQPYFYLSFEANVPVINQNNIKVRSNKVKINVKKFSEPKLTNKKTELSLTSDTKNYNTETKSGNLVCKITNLTQYPIPLFNDPGAVRFKVYAYNPNRTSVMHTEYILDNGQLPVAPVSITSKQQHIISIPLQQLLFNDRPEKATIFWTWNKKNPPISPLIYGKKDMAISVEFWFGVVVDGQEFLSNTMTINIDTPAKKTIKK